MTPWDDRPRQRLGPVAAIVAGDGPPLILLHGVGLRAEAWAPIIDHFAQTHRVIAPDMAGHGASERLDTRPTLSAFADRMAPLVTGQTVIAGHSMGAMLALHLAARLPDRIAGVVALNAIFRRDADAATAVRSRAAALDGQTATNPEQTLVRWFGSVQSPARHACDRWMRNVDPAAYKAAYTVFAAEDGPATTTLSALPCPALFLTGAAEPNSTPAMSRSMAALCPHGTARIVPDAAHMLPMTHPDHVIADLTALIDRARNRS